MLELNDAKLNDAKLTATKLSTLHHATLNRTSTKAILQSVHESQEKARAKVKLSCRRYVTP